MQSKWRERTALVLDLYLEQKLSAIAIEKQEHISVSATYRILRAAGISPAALRDSGERLGNHGGSRRFTLTTEQQIVADYQAGQGLHALAVQYEASVPTIRRCLKRQGQPARNRGGQRKVVPQDISRGNAD